VAAAAGLVKAASTAQPPVHTDASHSGVVHNLDNRKLSRWTPISHTLKLTHGVALQQVAGHVMVPLAVATCKALVYKETKMGTSHLALQLLVVTGGALPLTPIPSSSRLVPTLGRCTA
jgi:hypothetical protein